MEAKGFEVNERLVRSDSLHEISGRIYDEIEYYHDIRGIQEICERKDMKAAVAKYLEWHQRIACRYKKKAKRKGR
jgi:hypothetical protein